MSTQGLTGLDGGIDMDDEGWVVLPDRPEAVAVAVGRPTLASHESGRPWLLGPIDPSRLILACAGPVRVAVIGTCPVTAGRLADLISSIHSVAELDSVARVLPGSWHLVASVAGAVRVQGSLAGLRRVFYGRTGAVMVAGGRADALAALSHAGIDEHALAARVACAGSSPPQPPINEGSYWRGVRGVAPDHYLRLDRTGTIGTVCWWHAPEPEQPLTLVAPMVRRALEEAVAARRPATGRLSGDLSGGFDSTSLCFLAAADTPDLLTFRWAEVEAGNDDAVYAGHAAAALKAAEHLVVPQAEMPGQYADPGQLGDVEAPYRFGRTLARYRHNAALLTALGSRTHLAGHGGDELFDGGRPVYLHTLVRRHPFRAIARVRAHRSLGRWSWPATCLALASRGDITRWWRAEATKLTSGPVPRYAPPFDWGYPIRAQDWVTPAALDIARSVVRAAAEEARPLAADRGQHATLVGQWTSSPLYRQLARVYAAAGTRLELPYLDDRVVDVALSARLDERINPWRFKPLLADAMNGALPPLIAARTTKGEFSADAQAGWRKHLPDLLAVFADSALAECGLIHPDKLRAALLTPQADLTVMFAVEDLLGCEAWLRASRLPANPSPVRRSAMPRLRPEVSTADTHWAAHCREADIP